MQAFITGATGFIGQKLSIFLAEKGIKVKALVRSEKKAQALNHSNITKIQGDLQDLSAIAQALEGCEMVFHLAALAKVWDKDMTNFHKINVIATKHLLQLAQEKNTKRFIFTSTGGVLGASVREIVRENTPLQTPLTTEYERTKAEAERLVLSANNPNFETIVVNPTRVYGSGELSQSNAVTTLIQRYIEGKWRFLPANGESIGNYVFIDDVVKGHYLAWQKGRAGERYILGGENVSYNQFFKQLAEVSERKQRLYPIPLALMLAFANWQAWRAKIFGIPPIITPDFVRKYHYHWQMSSEKAIQELDYQPTRLKEGLKYTIHWLKTQTI